ncbi:amino acid ABC transporter substrate-binding protein, PAAT family [Stanieria cyanosphaera PCC 7437]|uniref:Amino acid ABC transporter substrate-binding protein, PAAT family n=1 Tax=Stanieria cyanosphaera (strain ATCC 29371 / PCC 7437) TaxID=111780 RepID=K9XUG8_STAC7|nr:transporter substrate-binding domain-containing protein [Stanieria cyanosphaera]AFZ36178.1 amino acid ABC transporter substrate-binding protein, PAAT family [Stanieria cyanosphaera PCC 7437]
MIKFILYKKVWQQAFLLGLLLIVWVNPAQSKELPKSLRVGTKPFAPFAFIQNGQYIGFSIDLWNAIANQLNIEYELYGEETVTDLLNSVSSSSTDVAIAGITITAEREKTVDFSHPFFESGLQIMVPLRSNSLAVPSFLGIIFSPIFLNTIGVLLVVILISAHLLWFFERKHNPEMFPKEYLSGIGEACWWSVVTVVTVGYGDKTPKGIPGRMIAVVWMFSGVLLISYFTASISSALTVQKLENSIQGIESLNGKRVATVKGSTASQYLANLPINITEFEQVEDVFKSLEEHQVDAVVYDAPVLKHYASQQGVGKVQVVGSVFAKQSYGIALKQDSLYREQINQALLKLQENGTYEELYEKWFGQVN